MKNNLLILFLCSFLVSSNVKEVFVVNGMHCGFGCADKIKSVINSIDGVRACDVNYEESQMIVEYNSDLLDSNTIITAIHEKTTYKTAIKSEKPKTFWSKMKNIFSKKS